MLSPLPPVPLRFGQNDTLPRPEVKRDSEGFIELPPVAGYAQPYGDQAIREFVSGLVQAKRQGPVRKALKKAWIFLTTLGKGKVEDPLADWETRLNQLLKPNKHLAMFTTRPQGFPFPWLFAHRPGADLTQNAVKGAVHALTVVKGPNNQPHLFLLITKRPPMGGDSPHAVYTVETPAGIWGDQDAAERGVEVASREVQEETGQDPRESTYLAPQKFATSPGGFTETKVLALTFADGESNRQNLVVSEAEDKIIAGNLLVPLETFENTQSFKTWLTEMDRQNLMVGLDVLATRSLIDDSIRQKYHAHP